MDGIKFENEKTLENHCKIDHEGFRKNYLY